MYKYLLLVGLVLVGVGEAQADPMYDYNWSPDNAIISTQTGGITMAATPLTTVTGNQSVLVAIVQTFGTLADGTVETVTNGDYNLSVDLMDHASGQATTLNFLGQLAGTFSATTSDLTNSFLTGTQEAVLGQNLYKVELTSFGMPGPVQGGEQGQIMALITVTPNGTTPPPPPPVNQAPEPSTLLLLGLGVPMLVGARYRRK